MKKRTQTSRWLVAAMLIAPAGYSQLAQSTFDTNADGWVSVMLSYPHAIPINILGTYSPSWQAGGFLRIQDPDGSGQTGNVQYWLAPAKFLADKSTAYGGRLSFDLINAGSGFGSFHQEDVILVGGGLTLVYDLTNAPATSWTNYSVPLVSGRGWRRDSLSGPAATPADLQTALAAVSQLFIRGEYQLGPDTESLDNVLLCAGGRLTITLAGTNVVLSWPQATCNAVLEDSFALGTAALWSAEGSSPGLMGDNRVVTNAVVEMSRFYRLRLQ